jgi:hypothetical protein
MKAEYFMPNDIVSFLAWTCHSSYLRTNRLCSLSKNVLVRIHRRATRSVVILETDDGVLDLQHSIAVRLLGGLALAPVDNPTRVLDIGTGKTMQTTSLKHK